MPEREQIILDVETGVNDAPKANADLAAVERQAQKTGDTVVRVSDRSRNSIERLVASAEKQAAVYGKTGTERLVAQRDMLIKRLGNEQAAIERVNRAYGTMIDQQKKLDSTTLSMTESLKRAGAQLGEMYLSFQGLKAVIKDVAVDSALFAAKTETYGVALEAAARANNISIPLLHQQEQGLKRLGIATQEARQSLLRMITAQIDLAKAQELGRLAQDVAVIGLMNSSQAFEQLIYGIQSASVRVLRTIGINVSFQESYERLAKQLGKTTLELSEQEKTVARVNEVLRVAPQYAGLYEESMTSVGKQMTSLKRYFDEARNAVGNQFQPALEKVVKTLTELLKLIQGHPELGSALTVAATGGLGALAAKFLLGPTAGTAVGLGVVGLGSMYGMAKAGQWVGRQLGSPLLYLGAETPDARQAAMDLQDALAEARKQGMDDAAKKLVEWVEITYPAQLRENAWNRLVSSRTEQGYQLRIERAQSAVSAAKENKDAAGFLAATAELNRIQALYDRFKEVRDKGEKLFKGIDQVLAKTYQKEAKDKMLTVDEPIGLMERWQAAEQANAQARRRLFDESRAASQRAFEEEQRLELQSMDNRHAAEMRALERMAGASIESQAAVIDQQAAMEEAYQAQRLEREITFLRARTEASIAAKEAELRALGVSEEQIGAYTAGDRAILEQQIARLRLDAEAKIAEARDTAAQKHYEMQQRSVEQLRSSIEGLVDAGLAGGRSFWEAWKRMFWSIFLTPVKNALVNLGVWMFSGQRFGGSFSLGGLLGGFGGGNPASMIGPGGTAPFAGGSLRYLGTGAMGLPILAGGGTRTGSILGGIGASNLGMLGVGAGVLGGFGAFKLGQSGSPLRYGAPAFGAAAGLFGFGGLSMLFPSLVAAGPVGWIASAGIGAFAGLLGLFKKSAEQKAREKIKALYGVDISHKGLLKQIVDTAKQAFGGNLDMAIRSQQIRDLVQLYAMSTGQSTRGMPATVHPLDIVQTGGSLYQSPGYSNGTALPGLGGLPTLDTIGGGVASGAGLGTTVVNLQIDSKTVGNVIIQNGRVVAQGAINAMKANAGRRELTALQLSPSLVMR